MWWGPLLGVLFFIPVFGMAIGAGLGALMGKVTKSGIDRVGCSEVEHKASRMSKYAGPY